MDTTIAKELSYMTFDEIKSWIGCPVFLEDLERNNPLGNKWYIVKEIYEDINRELQAIIMTTGEAFFLDLGNFKNPKFRRPVSVSSAVHYLDNWV